MDTIHEIMKIASLFEEGCQKGHKAINADHIYICFLIINCTSNETVAVGCRKSQLAAIMATSSVALPLIVLLIAWSDLRYFLISPSPFCRFGAAGIFRSVYCVGRLLRCIKRHRFKVQKSAECETLWESCGNEWMATMMLQLVQN